MPKILSFYRQKSKEKPENLIRQLWIVFSSLDLELKLGLLSLLLLLILTPIITHTVFEIRQRAAGTTTLETENGTFSATGVSVIADATASGGQYIQFTSTTGTASPTPTKAPTPTPTRTPTQTPTNTPTPIGSGTNPQPIGVGGSWHMVFNDEFNGSSLDTSKWTPGWFGSGITNPVDSSEIDCFNSSHVTEPGDGSLHLLLTNDTITCGTGTEPYTGALIQSDGKYSYTYGYIEFRAYLPGQSNGGIANWPGLWAAGQNWPGDGENDVMEGLGGPPCYHFHSPSGGPGDCASGNFGNGWHLYGADWEPGVVTYYYDGKQVGQITLGITSAPMAIRLNSSVAADSPISVPADMKVDYVRVWQH